MNRAGLKLVEPDARSWVDRMREYAKALSWTNQLAGHIGAVTADEVRAYAQAIHCHPRHSNAYGALFKGKGWTLIGYKKSTWPSNHSRRISVWRWDDNE